MSNNLESFHRLIPIFSLVAAIIAAPVAMAVEREKVLYAFRGGSDGHGPSSALVSDQSGNFYGTTVEGGGGTGCNDGNAGCGTVFKIAPDGTETVLHAFGGGCDGATPRAGLVMDDSGNLYGATQAGGTCSNTAGFGTIYKIAPDGTESLLYAFQGGDDGEYPVGDLAMDGQGNLYGAAGGGDPNGCDGGCGLVFKITPQGEKSVAYAFQGGADGEGPYGDVIIDSAGDLYGTTMWGVGTGCFGYGCGTVFKLAPDGTETVLYAFQGGADGWIPETGVVMDGAGNLYGTTSTGGSGVSSGTVFKVTPDGTHSVLHSFQGGTDGAEPRAGVILDTAGNLYGTTYGGGGKGCKDSDGCGLVYKVAPDGTETVLRTFDKDRPLGRYPQAGLLLGEHGRLYGTTSSGGKHSNGLVFELKK